MISCNIINNMKKAISTLSLLILLHLNAEHLLAQSEHQLQNDAKPTFVIVHGAWGGSWAFKEVEMLLREKGYDVYRPSLTGLGERVHLATQDVNLSTHLNDVINAVLFEELEDIILVGHSYGGMVITGVAHQIPERIKSLIYIDAFLPNDGESVYSWRQMESDFANLEEDGYLVPSWISPEQQPPSDVPHPAKTFTEGVNLENEAAYNIPGTYILTVEQGTDPDDDDFSIHAIRAEERGWPVLILDSDHNPQWSHPVKLVKMLHQNW